MLGASSKEELARTLGEMTPIGFMGVVGADVEVDINNPERYTSWMGQSGLGLPDESYYREEAQAPLRQAYMAHMARMLTLAGLAESFGALVRTSLSGSWPWRPPWPRGTGIASPAVTWRR